MWSLSRVGVVKPWGVGGGLGWWSLRGVGDGQPREVGRVSIIEGSKW